MNKLAKSLHTVTAAYNVALMLQDADSEQYAWVDMGSVKANELASMALEILGYAEPFYSDPHGLKEQIIAKLTKKAKVERKALYAELGLAV